MDDFYLACIGLTDSEKTYYINSLLNIKDLNGEYSLLQLYIKKENESDISFSGIVYKGAENKMILGNIYIYDKEVIVDTQITIVDPKGESKVYATLDRFRKKMDISKTDSQKISY